MLYEIYYSSHSDYHPVGVQETLYISEEDTGVRFSTVLCLFTCYNLVSNVIDIWRDLMVKSDTKRWRICKDFYAFRYVSIRFGSFSHIRCYVHAQGDDQRSLNVQTMFHPQQPLNIDYVTRIYMIFKLLLSRI